MDPTVALGSILTFLTTVVTAVLGYLTVRGRRRTEDVERYQRESEEVITTWWPKMRVYIAELRGRLGDLGVDTEDPPKPPWTKRADATKPVPEQKP